MIKALLALTVIALAAANACQALDGITAPANGLPPVASEQQDPAIAQEKPGEGTDFTAWTDWTGGVSFTHLSRINILISTGMVEPNGGMFSDHWESGPGVSLDAGYAFAPFLSVAFSLDWGLISGSEDDTMYLGNQVNFETSDFTMLLTGLEVRLRLPFNLIGPGLFRFSKAREGLGFVPAVKFGFGAAKVSKACVEYWESGNYRYPTVFEGYVGRYFEFGFELELRWRYSGIALSYSIYDVSPPEILFGHDLLDLSAGKEVKHHFISLSVGLYF